MDASMALKTFELSNSIDMVQSVNEIYKYSKEEQQAILQRKPWTKEYACSFILPINAVGSISFMKSGCKLCLYLHDRVRLRAKFAIVCYQSGFEMKREEI